MYAVSVWIIDAIEWASVCVLSVAHSITYIYNRTLNHNSTTFDESYYMFSIAFVYVFFFSNNIIAANAQKFNSCASIGI